MRRPGSGCADMRAVLIALTLAVATPAVAQEARFCPNRPDLGSGACTTEPGRVLVEMSVLDAERDPDGDTTLIGDVLVRTGLGVSTELQIGWTALGLARGGSERATGIGDIRLGLRQNLIDPTGERFAVAVEPFVTLPVGRQPIGRDGASYGVVVPVGIPLNDSWDLGLTGQASAEPDGDGRGRHLALLGIAGLGYTVSEEVSVVGELSIERDDDPDDATTELLAAGSIAWRPRELLQFDLLVAAGLNRAAPDVRVALGGAILF